MSKYNNAYIRVMTIVGSCRRCDRNVIPNVGGENMLSDCVLILMKRVIVLYCNSTRTIGDENVDGISSISVYSLGNELIVVIIVKCRCWLMLPIYMLTNHECHRTCNKAEKNRSPSRDVYQQHTR